jgi:titin
VKAAETVRPPASTVRLSWQDNSNDESGFVIERCDQTVQKNDRTLCNGTWSQVGSVGANVAQYVDTTVAPHQTYIYRIKAVNSAGSSGYTAEAAITAPAKQLPDS